MVVKSDQLSQWVKMFSNVEYLIPKINENLIINQQVKILLNFNSFFKNNFRKLL